MEKALNVWRKNAQVITPIMMPKKNKKKQKKRKIKHARWSAQRTVWPAVTAVSRTPFRVHSIVPFILVLFVNTAMKRLDASSLFVHHALHSERKIGLHVCF